MTRSSPLRGPLFSSPDRTLRSSFILDDRNSESSHLDALAAAQSEHERVRQAAMRVFELHELNEVRQRILDQERREQRRLEAEAEVAAEQKRLQELKVKSIPKPSPPPPPPPQQQQKQQQQQQQLPSLSSSSVSLPQLQPGLLPPSPQQQQPPFRAAAESAAQPTLTTAKTTAHEKPGLANPSNVTANLPSNGLPVPKIITQEAALPPAAAASSLAQATAQPQTIAPRSQKVAQRYRQIHQELKKLRKDLLAQSKVAGSPLKEKMGPFRREIRVAVGQLTGVKGANAQSTSKIISILKQALEGQAPSPPIDVDRFVLEPRVPVDNAPNNGPTLPSLFIYLLNMCAKGIINQFINECGANPKAADPIGVFTAHIFSHKDLQWRGKSLIDILLAKFCVSCPVLFGFRGSDRTERGRLAIGWRRDGPSWIAEQSHNDRMAGLGAGFASISLRDFSKANKTNPYPPTHYWNAIAGIVNTPAGETSNTQCIVLRSMIDGHEQRFLDFYGNAALAALRDALVEFPNKTPNNSSAAGSLRALAEVLRTERGLSLP